ncbi:uncharacterized [Tachysurus ichikawai]
MCSGGGMPFDMAHHACQASTHLSHSVPTLFEISPMANPTLGQNITPASPSTATAAHSYTPKMLHSQLAPFLRCRECSQAVPLSALYAINVLEFCSRCAHLRHINAASDTTAGDQSSSSRQWYQY